MPTYSYHCDSCGHDFDKKQSFSAEPQHECPNCQNIARRTFSAPAVIYKGSGFYTTDYARKSGGSSSSSSGSSSSSNSSSGSSSTAPSSGDSSSSSSSTSSSSSSSSGSSGSDSK